MPGAPMEGHKLGHGAASIDKQVRGDPQILKRPETGMGSAVNPVHEQLLRISHAEGAGW